MVEEHRVFLSRQCRICGYILGKSPMEVYPLANRLKSGLYLDILQDDPNIQPTKICLPCYAKLKHIENRKTTLNFTSKKWTKHSLENCICQIRKKAGRKKKPKPTGRRSQDSKMWTREVIAQIYNNIPESLNITVPLNQINSSSKFHLELCICKICKGLIDRPVILKDCQHSYCLNCLLPTLEGKKEDDTRCTECSTKILLNQVIPSINVTELLKCLKIECKNCAKTYSITQLAEKTEHEQNCTYNVSSLLSSTSSLSNSQTLSDVFKTTDSDEISRNMEDAALHILKTKMKQSSSNTVEFCSGGPRVRIYDL